MQVELRKKYLDLLDRLRSYGSVAVAFQEASTLRCYCMPHARLWVITYWR